MKDTYNHYKLALIKRVVLERLIGLGKEANLNELAEELGLETARALLERALKELEDEGYIIRLQDAVERTWALRQCDENWRPRGLKTLATINTPIGQDAIEALVIKGLEEAREVKPLNQVLAILLKARLIAESAQTPKALHYSQHLTLKAIAKAVELKAVSRRQANKIMKNLKLSGKLSKKNLLITIAKIEEMIKKADGKE